MPSTAELALLLTANDQASKKLDDVGKSAGGLGKHLGDVAKIAGGFVIGAGLLQLPNLIGGMIGKASDLNESLSKAQTVFGDSFEGIDKFASGAATSMGMTRQAALEATGTFGNFLQSMGAGREPAADMSKAMVKLASDLGSFNNANPEEVLLALRSGLSGEAEPMKRFGVALSESAVKAKALQLGLKPVGKELSEQQKIQARYAIIMEQTATAQGDFERTSGGLANRTKILSAQFSELQTKIGTALLPVMVGLAGVVVNSVIPAVEKLVNFLGTALAGPVAKISAFFGQARGAISGFVGALKGGSSTAGSFSKSATAIGGTMGKIVGFVKAAISQVKKSFGDLKVYFDSDIKPALQNLQTAFMAIVGVIRDNWPLIMAIIKPIIDQFVLTVQTAVGIIGNILAIIIDLIQGDFSGAWKNLKELVGVVWNYIQGTIENVLNYIKGLAGLALAAAKAIGQAIWDGITSIISGLADEMWKLIKAGINKVIDGFNSLIRAWNGLEFHMGGTDLGIFGKLPAINVGTPDLPTIPTLAKGTPYVPNTGLALLHKGEAVIPADQNRAGSGGVTVNVAPGIYGHQEVARIIRDVLAGGGMRGYVRTA